MKSALTRTVSKKSAPATKASAVKKAAAKKPAVKKAAATKPAPRADYGAPVDGFFAKQPPAMRPIVDALRELVDEAAPKAESSLEWGMPFYALDGAMVCAIGGHKSHVNLILPGPAGAYPDPEGRLSGESKVGRHLKIRTLDELPRESVRKGLRAAVKLANGESR